MTTSLLPQMDRRQFLLGAGGLALAVGAPGASCASPRSFMTSETGTLRRVLINPATIADHAGCGMMEGTNPFWQDAVADVIAQQADMVLQLESAGTEVLRLRDVLETAIESARRQGAWDNWLRSVYPERAGSNNVCAATLLAGDRLSDETRAQQAMHGLCYVRDFAVMLPRGLVLCNVANPTRSRQSALFRFMVAFAPAFRDYPVLFDAPLSGLHAEGGDLQMLDESTLLVGVGNHTDSRIAARLAQHTGMDVVAVNIRNADTARWKLDHDPLRDFFFHLNTSIAQIAPGHVLALPWLFEAKHTGHSVLGCRNSLIADFGTVTQYRACSGDSAPSLEGLKLVDYLRVRGFRVTYIGGAQRDDAEHWLADTARTGVIFPRRERQAANMLATASGMLLAFGGAERTHAALRSDGICVSSVAGREMSRGYGGPHCLTLPLERT
jgi:arginine deiminase